MSELTVRQLMTTRVVTLNRHQSLPTAEELLRIRRIRHLPVVDDEGALVGLVTHRDVLAAQISVLARLTGDERAELQLATPISKLMKTSVWTVAPDTPALEAARIMVDHNYGCLPVVKNNKLVGIISEADLLRLMIKVLEGDRQQHTATTVKLEQPGS